MNIAFAIDAYQPRNAQRNVGPLKSLDGVQQVSVRHRGPRTQPNVLGPRRNDVSLDKQPVFPKVAKDTPAVGPIATSYRLDGMDRAQERFAMPDIDPALDLNCGEALKARFDVAQAGDRQAFASEPSARRRLAI